jgi:nicotinamidase-related amidase
MNSALLIIDIQNDCFEGGSNPLHQHNAAFMPLD